MHGQKNWPKISIPQKITFDNVYCLQNLYKIDIELCKFLLNPTTMGDNSTIKNGHDEKHVYV